MNRIESTFNRLRKERKKALITYIMAGDPDLPATEKLVTAIEKAGADILELGVPFSDPLADGPAIQRAAERALASGTSLRKVMSLVKKLRKKGITVPVIIMTYYNIIFRYGIDRFPKDAVSSGIDGLIIPDLPPEESAELLNNCRSSGLDTIFLLAPTSTENRIKLVTSHATGFVYYVSMTGITGAKLSNISGIKAKIKQIRKYTDLPIAVGFGISKKTEADQIGRWADGVIIGSALVKVIEKNQGKRTLIPRVTEFIKSIKGM